MMIPDCYNLKIDNIRLNYITNGKLSTIKTSISLAHPRTLDLATLSFNRHLTHNHPFRYYFFQTIRRRL
jgi:hypothetical protein